MFFEICCKICPNFFPPPLHLQEDNWAHKHISATHEVSLKRILNRLSNDMQHDTNRWHIIEIKVIEYEYPNFQYEEILWFCMVVMVTLYLFSSKVRTMPTSIFLALILQPFRKYLLASPNMRVLARPKIFPLAARLYALRCIHTGAVCGSGSPRRFATDRCRGG